MSDIVIQVEGLSKQYRLGEVSTGSLGHDVNRWWHRVRGKADPYLSVTGENIRTRKRERRGKAEKLKSENSEMEQEKDNHGKSKIMSAFQRFSVSDLSPDYVWALKDINFEVKRGEVLGIIGRNGAGKSTLLKILSRITAPTTGEVRVKGRIASLLEIGTGFHQDLTGLENIFLNGAILGMTKKEVRGKFDDIVEFSGCAAYLDTPVKRYSSGMVVRLAFAVAAHLDPEILIVDEVLAVGDAEFQRKCLGKMSEVASQGRTVLFVSHNMRMISQLTSRCVVLSAGGTEFDGPTDHAIDHYIGEQMKRTTQGRVPIDKLDYEQRFIKNPEVVIHEVGIVSPEAGRLPFGKPLVIEISVNVSAPHSLIIGYTVRNGTGDAIVSGWSPAWEISLSGVSATQLVLAGLNLAPGHYCLNCSIQDAKRGDVRRPHDVLIGWGHFEVTSLPPGQVLFENWSAGWGSIVHSGGSLLPIEPSGTQDEV